MLEASGSAASDIRSSIPPPMKTIARNRSSTAASGNRDPAPQLVATKARRRMSTSARVAR